MCRALPGTYSIGFYFTWYAFLLLTSEIANHVTEATVNTPNAISAVLIQICQGGVILTILVSEE